MSEPFRWPPLKANHPLITEGRTCWLCGDPFEVGDETAPVAPVLEPDGKNERVQIAHARCAESGMPQ
jgi:hypothetical protein